MSSSDSDSDFFAALQEARYFDHSMLQKPITLLTQSQSRALTAFKRLPKNPDEPMSSSMAIALERQMRLNTNDNIITFSIYYEQCNNCQQKNYNQ